MNREIGFEEFKERAKARDFNPRNVTVMWKWLAEHRGGYELRDYVLTDCTIPLETILSFTPSMAEGAKGVSLVLLKVYRFVYQSLLDDPSPLPDHDEEVTRENLRKFAPDVHPGTITSAWHEFRRAMSGLSEEQPLIEQLELFCGRMEDRDNWPIAFKPAYDKLLRDWLKSLQSQQGK
ncbi:MAG TPA: hypothetical protein VFH06_01705 [Candidatus Saccharimonadales bacterium]|nr:hypothetical protein [Candidatus Saccharimonadales bacterium]